MSERFPQDAGGRHIEEKAAAMGAITLLNPYQELGTAIPEDMSTSAALAHVGLSGWNQRLVEPFISDGTTLIGPDGWRFNVADLPGGGTKVLGAVKASYRPIQNEEAFLPLIDGWDGTGLRAATAGAWDGGRASFVCFEVPGFAIGGADGFMAYLVATKRSDGGGSVRVMPSAYRVRCANQLNGLARGSRPVVSVRHTSGADPYAVQQAEMLMGLTTDWGAELEKEIRRLARIDVPRAVYVDRIVPALLGERATDEGRSQTIYDRKSEQLVAAWDSPVHVDGDTGWRAYSAVSEWELHHRSGNRHLMASAAVEERQPCTMKSLAVIGSMA